MVLPFLTRSGRKERRVLRAQFRGGGRSRQARTVAVQNLQRIEPSGVFPRERDFKPKGEASGCFRILSANKPKSRYLRYSGELPVPAPRSGYTCTPAACRCQTCAGTIAARLNPARAALS